MTVAQHIGMAAVGSMNLMGTHQTLDLPLAGTGESFLPAAGCPLHLQPLEEVVYELQSVQSKEDLLLFKNFSPLQLIGLPVCMMSA